MYLHTYKRFTCYKYSTMGHCSNFFNFAKPAAVSYNLLFIHTFQLFEQCAYVVIVAVIDPSVPELLAFFLVPWCGTYKCFQLFYIILFPLQKVAISLSMCKSWAHTGHLIDHLHPGSLLFTTPGPMGDNGASLGSIYCRNELPQTEH